SACPSCTGTATRRWTCHWPRTPAAPWWFDEAQDRRDTAGRRRRRVGGGPAARVRLAGARADGGRLLRGRRVAAPGAARGARAGGGLLRVGPRARRASRAGHRAAAVVGGDRVRGPAVAGGDARSEERRVGKGGRSRWWW